VELIDFQGRKIVLSDESWLHIKEDHPEISIDEIENALLNPDEVRASNSNSKVEIYYAIKTVSPKTRFRCVVVKILDAGCFVSTAMTTSKMKSGKTIFQKRQGT
jgi:hypothetical protein